MARCPSFAAFCAYSVFNVRGVGAPPSLAPSLSNCLLLYSSFRVLQYGILHKVFARFLCNLTKPGALGRACAERMPLSRVKMPFFSIFSHTLSIYRPRKKKLNSVFNSLFIKLTRRFSAFLPALTACGGAFAARLRDLRRADRRRRSARSARSFSPSK